MILESNPTPCFVPFCQEPIRQFCQNPVPTKFKAGGLKVVGLTSLGGAGFPGGEISLGSNGGNAPAGATGA